MKRRWIIVMAIRNLFRYRRRTLITAGAIAFGLTAYIWVDSFLAGADEQSVRNLRWYETADAAAAVPGYVERRETAPLGPSFLPDGLLAELDRAGYSATPRILFGADLVFYRDPFPEDGSIPGIIIAVDPRRDGRVFRLEDTLVDGRWLRPGEGGLVMGRRLAESLGAGLGYPLIAVTRTRDGYLQTLDLDVVGILDCPNPLVNRNGLYIDLDFADQALEMDGRVSLVHVSLPDGVRRRRREERLRILIANQGLDYADWRRLGADYVNVMQSERAGSALMIVLILLVAAVGISNTMLMAVLERSREIGMMRALGMSDRFVRRLFLWESAGIGLLGSIGGVVLGVMVNIPFVRRGLDLRLFMEGVNFGYRSSGQFYGAWHAAGFGYAVLLGTGLAVAVAALSIRRLTRLGIAESLRRD